MYILLYFLLSIMISSIIIFLQVAYVVKKNGLLSKRQNIVVGYGVPLGVICVSMALNLYGYGGL